MHFAVESAYGCEERVSRREGGKRGGEKWGGVRSSQRRPATQKACMWEKKWICLIGRIFFGSIAFQNMR
jgi:hypothetical protein